MADNRQEIIEELKVAYWMEMETVMSYIANSINLDGVRAEEIKKALAADITAELGHAQTLARRIKTIGGTVPGSMDFHAMQQALQPLPDTTDVLSVIRGVIAAEDAAVAQYTKFDRAVQREILVARLSVKSNFSLLYFHRKSWIQ